MNRDITLGILLGYKTILQIVAFVLTFSIQKVKLKGLNDAKYIAVAVYITNFVTAIYSFCHLLFAKKISESLCCTVLSQYPVWNNSYSGSNLYTKGIFDNIISYAAY